jgi:hypothetical protein
LHIPPFAHADRAATLIGGLGAVTDDRGSRWLLSHSERASRAEDRMDVGLKFDHVP